MKCGLLTIRNARNINEKYETLNVNSEIVLCRVWIVEWCVADLLNVKGYVSCRKLRTRLVKCGMGSI